MKNLQDIEKLTRHPRTTLKALDKMAKGIREGNPERTYAGLAHYRTILIAGPYVKHDRAAEETNRQLFAQTLRECFDAIQANKTRKASSIMHAWMLKLETEKTKALLPEHLMPVAILARTVVGEAFDDSIVFISPRFEAVKKSYVKNLLGWAHKTMLTGNVNVREFFGAQNAHKVLPSGR